MFKLEFSESNYSRQSMVEVRHNASILGGAAFTENKNPYNKSFNSKHRNLQLSY